MCKRRRLWVHSPSRLNWQQVTDDFRAPESHWSSSGLNCRYRFKFLALAINMYCFVNIVTELVIRACEWTFECCNWKRNLLKSMFLGSKRCQHASHIWLVPGQPPAQALRLGKRLVMNRKGPWEGYRRQAKRRLAHCLLPSFLCAHIFIERERERRLGSRQVPSHFYKWPNDGHLTAKIENTTRAVSTCFVPRPWGTQQLFSVKYLFGEANIA